MAKAAGLYGLAAAALLPLLIAGCGKSADAAIENEKHTESTMSIPFSMEKDAAVIPEKIQKEEPIVIIKNFEESKEVFGNPLKGYAMMAENTDLPEDVTLVYIDITWRELEPKEGEYNWEEIEKENHLEEHKKAGRHVVLRFLCDKPKEESVRDIPDWLYEKTKKDGAWYETSYGEGYAPNYNNPVFIEAHRKAILELGKHFEDDTFISFVELGSLGHWGEWHVNRSEDKSIPEFPLEAVRLQYIAPYIEAFPQAKILMRRPFAPARKYGFGLYNDQTGDKDATETWLHWIAEGGEFGESGEPKALVSMRDYWKKAPVGGEFTPRIEMSDLLDSDLEQTLDLLRKSHTTFLGPHTGDPEYKEGYNAVLNEMGYRIWISSFEVKTSDSLITVTLTWENSGIAPFYWDWPVYLCLINESDGVVTASKVSLKLTSLLPGSKIETKTILPVAEETGLQLAIGVIDPMINKPSVRLSMDGTVYTDGWNYLTDILNTAK